MMLVEGEVLGEERDNFGFDAIADVVEVVTIVESELMGDAVVGQDFVELLGGECDLGVLVAGIEADGVELTEVSDVLVDHVERFVGVEFGHGFLYEFAVLHGKVGEERRILRIGRPGSGNRYDKPGKEFESICVFWRLGGLGFAAIFGEEGIVKGHAAGAEQIDAGEDVGMAHADADGAVAAHGVSGEATAVAFGDGAVVGVNIGDEFVDDVVFPVTGGYGVRVKTALVACERVRRDENHFAIPCLGKGFVQHGGKINPVLGGPVPLVGAVGVTMEEVNDGVAAMAISRVAGRKVDSNIAVGRVALKVAFEEFAMNFDVFDGARGGRRGSLGSGRVLRAKQAQGAEVYSDKNPDQFEGFHGKGW